LLDASGKSVVTKPATPTANGDEYQARFQLTPIATGRVGFRCAASDQSDPTPLRASKTIQTFVDHGPTIEVISPSADSSWALKRVVPVEFWVRPTPLANPDTAANVAQVTFTAKGVNIPLTPVVGEPGHFKFTLDFNDRVRFGDSPAGAIAIAISGKNSRTPAVTNTTNYTIKVDGKGPVVAITNPPDNKVVGGQVLLEFSINDDFALVDKSTVKVKVGNDVSVFNPANGQWSEDNGNYTFRFDSTKIAAIAQVTIAVDADDTVGNQSPGDTLLLYIDNKPPIVDLNPPQIRERTLESGTSYCSDAFDPLGKAENDLVKLSNFGLFRALVWEETNGVLDPELDTLHYAGLNEDSVYLYLQPNTQAPLLVDTNGDNKCDDVKEELRRDPKVPYQHLSAVTPQGDSFGKQVGSPSPPSGCVLKDTAKADALCVQNASDLRRVIGHTMLNGPPVVFAVGALENLECMGSKWEIGSLIDPNDTGYEGWVCLVARAEDKVGNVGVSQPLRICVSDGTNPEPACATSSTTPPTCMEARCKDTASTAPPRFNYSIIQVH
jgi:hypothetical protein